MQCKLRPHDRCDVTGGSASAPTSRIAAVARCGALTLAAAALSLTSTSAAFARPITVNTRIDAVSGSDGHCSLREAVSAANSSTASGSAAGECPAGDAGGNEIVLAGGPAYVLTPAGGALHILSPLTIRGVGAASTAVDGGGVDRVLDVGPASSVLVTQVTIRGGRAPDGTNAAPTGGAGGGIRNGGVLTLRDATVSGNTAGTGRPSDSDPAIGRAGAGGGPGGGVYNTGSLTLVRSTIAGNRAGAGSNGFNADLSGKAAGTGGDGGAGGGLYNADGATLKVVDSLITGNHGGAGGAGGPGAASGYLSGAGGGSGGRGGGLWNAGTLSLAASSITANAAGRGGDGGGNGGSQTMGGGPGGQGGFGGGVFDDSATPQKIVNSTIAHNAAGAGGDGKLGGYGGDGGGGGGVVSANAILALLNATVSQNQVGAGGGDGGGGGGGIGGGGGVNAFGAASLQNTIVSGNGGGNCLGAMVDNGHNLSFPDATCPGVNGDPMLRSLRANGGPTPTMALGGRSAALDKVPATGAGCPATDQRGVRRPRGKACDIGAFEFALPVLTISSPRNGAHYRKGKRVLASFHCAEAGSSGLISSCVGTTANGHAIETSRRGTKTFTVTAVDKAGNRLSKTVHYTVKKRHRHKR